MVNTRSGDAGNAETSADGEARAARAAREDDFFDADDNNSAQQQQADRPEQAAAGTGQRAPSPRRAASPRPAGRGNRGRTQHRSGSAPSSRNQSPQQQQRPLRQNPAINISYDITSHERGEVRRMLIRNPPPPFEPTPAWRDRPTHQTHRMHSQFSQRDSTPTARAHASLSRLASACASNHKRWAARFNET